MIGRESWGPNYFCAGSSVLYIHKTSVQKNHSSKFSFDHRLFLLETECWLWDGGGGVCPQRPRRNTGPEGVFCSFSPPRLRFSPKVYGGLSVASLGWGLGRGYGRKKRKNPPRQRPVLYGALKAP